VRENGYAPIRDYAVIGDGRTAALVAKDGSIDWLCLPNFDSPSVFGRIVDTRRGGSFELRPEEPFEVDRAYRHDTNVLETTFRTASGSVRVTDAMLLTGDGLAPMREVARSVEGLAGRVPMCWHVEPRFDFGGKRPRIDRRAGAVFATAGGDALAISSWEAGDPQPSGDGIQGTFVTDAGTTALLDLASAHREPVVLPSRADVERRLEDTSRFWAEWAGRIDYEGPWRDAVVRSALALRLCVFAPSGAVVAAPTTSLPEWIGGARNWDYRFAWLRDAAFTIDALLRLRCRREASAFFWWFMHATRMTMPRLRNLYRVDGRLEATERDLERLDGYMSSRPVRVGNGAAEQVQLDVYGSVLDSIWRYASNGGEIDRKTGKEIAEIADCVTELWRGEDSGIWEPRSPPLHYVHSKAMCWVALDRACKLAERGVIADHRQRWEPAAEEIRAFVEEHGYDADRGTYVRARGRDDLDGALLTLALFDYHDPADTRLHGTIAAIERELSDGPLVYRYRGADGLDGREGYFLACSFWLVDALARTGRVADAKRNMEELLRHANDVGLYAEELAPDGSFLGNFPQALVHLALIGAALCVTDHDGGAD
jgi:GH15 family glucan-1,4-alpha-glucosidase